MYLHAIDKSRLFLLTIHTIVKKVKFFVIFWKGVGEVSNLASGGGTA